MIYNFWTICILLILANIVPFYFNHDEVTNPNIYQEENNQYFNHTFITMPKEPRKPIDYALLKFAVSNWITSSNNSKVVFVVDPSEFDVDHLLYNQIEEEFGPGKLIYSPTLKANRYKKPYVNSWWKTAGSISPDSIVTILNSDILIPPEWIDKVNQIFKVFGDSAFVTGYRLNFNIEDIPDILNFSYRDINITAFVHSLNTTEYSFRGMDFFTFYSTPGINYFEDTPPFIIGVYEYDNWLLGKMNHIYQTISLGPDFRVFHMTDLTNRRKIRFTPISIYNKRIRVLYNGYTSDNKHTVWELKEDECFMHTDPQRRVHIMI